MKTQIYVGHFGEVMESKASAANDAHAREKHREKEVALIQSGRGMRGKGRKETILGHRKL